MVTLSWNPRRFLREKSPANGLYESRGLCSEEILGVNFSREKSSLNVLREWVSVLSGSPYSIRPTRRPRPFYVQYSGFMS